MGGIKGLLITPMQDASRTSWYKRGSDSVALYFVFTVLWHMAVHLNKNKNQNSEGIPKSCQLHNM